MDMETYLASMFNHGATLVNLFSWGVGGEARKNMDFRVVTEGEEALRTIASFSAASGLSRLSLRHPPIWNGCRRKSTASNGSCPPGPSGPATRRKPRL